MLIRGDSRQLPLIAGCVDCVVTSPPYWGLRDYGTATWEGGDAGCDHSAEVRGSRFATPVSEKQRRNTGSGTIAHRVCVCGARRIDAQIGLESTPEAYVASLVGVFREVWRVLKDDGTLWLNLGDSYAGGGFCGSDKALKGKQGSNRGSHAMVGRALIHGVKPKDLVGIPWRVAFALQADGWYLRSDIIWSKPNPMPESVTDRPTKAHEYLFLLAKSERYHYDADAVREALAESSIERVEYGFRTDKLNVAGSLARGEPVRTEIKRMGDRFAPAAGRNKRSVWTVATMPYSGAHFATMPEKLVEPCILAGCPLGGLVLDPFVGSGTVLAVAERLGRRGVGTDLNYQHLAKERTAQRGLRFAVGD